MGYLFVFINFKKTSLRASRTFRLRLCTHFANSIPLYFATSLARLTARNYLICDRFSEKVRLNPRDFVFPPHRSEGTLRAPKLALRARTTRVPPDWDANGIRLWLAELLCRVGCLPLVERFLRLGRSVAAW